MKLSMPLILMLFLATGWELVVAPTPPPGVLMIDNNGYNGDTRHGYDGDTDNLKYMVGSKLTIKWNSHHSCGDPNNQCDVIIQTM